jgi:hypothetical protein
MTAPYKDPIIEAFITLIKSYRKDIKIYYNGIAGKIPASLAPAIMIGIEKDEVKEEDPARDEHFVSMVLVYIADMKQNFEDTPTIIAGLNNVMQTLIGRDANYSLLKNSILNIIRSNPVINSSIGLRADVGAVTVATPTEVAANRLQGYWSAEGTIRFTAHLYQTRNP